MKRAAPTATFIRVPESSRGPNERRPPSIAPRPTDGLASDETGKRNPIVCAVDAIAAASAESADLEGMMTRILRSVVDLMKAEAGTFFLVDERRKVLEGVGQGIPRFGLRGFHRRLVAELACDTANPVRFRRVELGDDSPLGTYPLKAAGFESMLCVPLESKGRLSGVIGILGRDGAPCHSVDAELVASLASQIGVAIENSLLYRRLTERIEETEVLYEVGRTLISTLDHDQVLSQILKVVQESLGYSRCGILLIDEDRGELFLKAAYGYGPEVAQDFRLKIGVEGITGWVAATGKAMNVPDIRKEPRYVRGPTPPPASELALPLKIGSQVIGVLDVQSSRIGAFGERDIRILSSFADQAAIAIENAQLYDRTREMGVMAERSRLAREIHDVLAQNLTGTIVQLEAADNLLVKGQTQKAQEVLRKAMEQARASLQEARRSIVGLRAAPLESLPLSEAIAGEIKVFSQEAGVEAGDETGVVVSFSSRGNDSALSPDVATALYRILKEGLSNIRRHASAEMVEVRLEVSADTCSLSIQDNGAGFDPHQIERLGTAGAHYGLIGMRERARLLGGSMSIESAVSTGTRVIVTIPLRAERRGISAIPPSLAHLPRSAHRRAGGRR